MRRLALAISVSLLVNGAFAYQITETKIWSKSHHESEIVLGTPTSHIMSDEEIKSLHDASVSVFVPSARGRIGENVHIVSDHDACIYNTTDHRIASGYRFELSSTGDSSGASRSLTVEKHEKVCAPHQTLPIYAHSSYVGSFPIVAKSAAINDYGQWVERDYTSYLDIK